MLKKEAILKGNSVIYGTSYVMERRMKMDNMKICPLCGKSVDGNTKFCNQCGYQFPETPAGATPVNPAPAAPVNPAPATPVNPAPAAPVNPAPAAPVNPAPAAPVNPAPAAPVNPAPAAPANNAYQQPMPNAQVNNGFQQPMPGAYQPSMGNNGAVPPSYVSNATNPEPKKGKGGLIAALITIGVLVIAAIGICAYMLFAEKSVLEFNSTKVTVNVEDEETVTVTNFEEIKEPDLEWTVEDDSIATVEGEADGTAVITGVAEGETIITVTGKGCEEATIRVTVEEVEMEIDLEGTAWDSGDIQYYFTDDGEFYQIYDLQGNYLYGSYEVSEVDEDEAADLVGQSVVDDLYDVAPEGLLYSIDLAIEEEWYSGALYGMSEYVYVFCYNGEDAAIYDQGWGMVMEVSEDSMEDGDDLYNTYFAMEGAEPDTSEPDSGNTGSTSNVTNGSISDISFDGDDRDGSYISSYGDNFVVIVDGDIYAITLDEINSGASPELLVDSSGEIHRVLLMEDKVVYSEEVGGEWKVCYANLSDGAVNVVYEGYPAYSIIANDDYIYCTDYSSLVRMDYSGSFEEVWEYSTFTFEVDEEYIYVFDGVSWEVLDVNTGEDLGYIVTGIDGAYEADIVREANGYLFFTMYEEASSDVYLYGMDLDGNITQLGEEMYGLSYDTYVVLFRDQYVYYTTSDRETLVRVDVTTGSQEEYPVFNEYGCWYINDLTMVGDQMIAYAYDTDNNAYCISIDPDTMEGYDLDNLTFY